MSAENKLKIKDKIAQEKKHWVRLTRVCNNNCLFCLDKDSQNGTVTPFSQIVKDLKKGYQEGASRAILSGGDPTLHPRLLEIIKKAKMIGYQHIQLITNGRMLAYENFTRGLKQAGLDEITLSLHSHLRKPFEEMTQVKGSYLQSMRGLQNALNYRFIVSIDIVINKINLGTLKDTLKFFIKFGVTEFDLLHPIPFGNAWRNKDKIFYSVAKAKKYLDKAFELSKNRDLFIWTNRLPAVFLEGHEELIQHPIKLKDEIKNREKGLKNYLKIGQPLFCFGGRCSYCFLEEFCQDLIELKNKGKLFSKLPPRCLVAKNRTVQTKPKTFWLAKNFNLDKFTDFYIKHRYFVKSLRCRRCQFYNQCDGAQIDEIRAKGFGILKQRPLKNLLACHCERPKGARQTRV
ncbi:radical SAM protein [Patescibacteria group bacterium]|nr:radical SAM protein [Patescibacteria group bacterium]